MNEEQIKQIKLDLESLDKAKQKKSKIDSVIKHIGKEGRNKEIGKWQNQFGCKVQVALQYNEGGTNYWYAEELNREFEKTIHQNFDELLMKTIERANIEYKQALQVFDKYGVKSEQEKD